MRLIRLIEHRFPGGPGEPQRKASSFDVAVRDINRASAAWGQAPSHAFLRHGKVLNGQNFRLSWRSRAVSNRDECAPWPRLTTVSRLSPLPARITAPVPGGPAAGAGWR